MSCWQSQEPKIEFHHWAATKCWTQSRTPWASTNSAPFQEKNSTNEKQKQKPAKLTTSSKSCSKESEVPKKTAIQTEASHTAHLTSLDACCHKRGQSWWKDQQKKTTASIRLRNWHEKPTCFFSAKNSFFFPLSNLSIWEKLTNSIQRCRSFCFCFFVSFVTEHLFHHLPSCWYRVIRSVDDGSEYCDTFKYKYELKCASGAFVKTKLFCATSTFANRFSRGEATFKENPEKAGNDVTLSIASSKLRAWNARRVRK